MGNMTAPGIIVNGIKISPDDVGLEVQHHPAESLFSAKYEAMQALVIRELLIQKSVELNLSDRDTALSKTDEIIDDLLAQEIDVPEPNEDNCQRFYDNNSKSFYTSPLFEASHILYPARPSDEKARAEALASAEEALKRIQKNPKSLADIARAESACSSSGSGGHLGQITKGQTAPAFEAALMDMQDNEISAAPVASEFGYHVIHVHKRIEGKQLPFEAVSEWIADYLKRASWQRAFSQYVQLLAGDADISGFRLKMADSPLVQ